MYVEIEIIKSFDDRKYKESVETVTRIKPNHLPLRHSSTSPINMFVFVEGCSELVSCMDGVKMTQEDSIIIDKISASEHSVCIS